MMRYLLVMGWLVTCVYGLYEGMYCGKENCYDGKYGFIF